MDDFRSDYLVSENAWQRRRHRRRCGNTRPDPGPVHNRWVRPRLTYDLDDRIERARVYEPVLSEGTEADVRYYVDAHELGSSPQPTELVPRVAEALGHSRGGSDGGAICRVG